MARKVGSRPSGTKGGSRGRGKVVANDRPWGSWALFGTIGVLAAVFIGFAAVQALGGDGQIKGVASFESLSRKHVTTNVDYPQSPPVGGPHRPVWADCTGTVYKEPVTDEKAVHSLEHGAVWITYRPGVPDDQVQRLRDLVSGTDYRLLSPYPDQPAPIMATAWGKQLKVQSADDSRLESFLEAYTQGPQTPERGASCQGAGRMP